MTLVLDASAACALLLRGPGAGDVEEAAARHDHVLCAPHLLDLEVLSVLRRKVTAGEMTVARAAEAVGDLGALPVSRYPHAPFAPRIWELRENLTPYDGAYVALTEVVEDAELATADRRLARAAHRHTGVQVALVPSGSS